MRLTLVGSFFASLVLLLAGCASSTPQDRISQNQNRATFEQYSSDVQKKITAGEVDIGFTEEMTTMALGKPGRVVTRSDAGGQSDVWLYYQHKPRIGFGFGVGSGGYGGVSSGVAVSTENRPDEETLRVIFRDHKVTAVETTTQR